MIPLLIGIHKAELRQKTPRNDYLTSFSVLTN